MERDCLIESSRWKLNLNYRSFKFCYHIETASNIHTIQTQNSTDTKDSWDIVFLIVYIFKKKSAFVFIFFFQISHKNQTQDKNQLKEK